MSYDGYCYDCLGECSNEASKSEWKEALKLYMNEHALYERALADGGRFIHIRCKNYFNLKRQIERCIVKKADNIEMLATAVGVVTKKVNENEHV